MSKFTIDTGGGHLRRRSALRRTRKALTPSTHSTHSVPLPFEVLASDAEISACFTPDIISSVANQNHHLAATLLPK
ncbi:hypothetical protein [Photobacterium jeanii]|uniref:hypothetical protein n=1 Tax=Photobacterium jeanii TaxID=858640 RepID=UPI000A4D4844|nr:hypothetical protein [Photobacterium jeanii]